MERRRLFVYFVLLGYYFKKHGMWSTKLTVFGGGTCAAAVIVVAATDVCILSVSLMLISMYLYGCATFLLVIDRTTNDPKQTSIPQLYSVTPYWFLVGQSTMGQEKDIPLDIHSICKLNFFDSQCDVRPPNAAGPSLMRCCNTQLAYKSHFFRCVYLLPTQKQP
jgi:hypothetical protein